MARAICLANELPSLFCAIGRGIARESPGPRGKIRGCRNKTYRPSRGSLTHEPHRARSAGSACGRWPDSCYHLMPLVCPSPRIPRGPCHWMRGLTHTGRSQTTGGARIRSLGCWHATYTPTAGVPQRRLSKGCKSCSSRGESVTATAYSRSCGLRGGTYKQHTVRGKPSACPVLGSTR